MNSKLSLAILLHLLVSLSGTYWFQVSVLIQKALHAIFKPVCKHLWVYSDKTVSLRGNQQTIRIFKTGRMVHFTQDELCVTFFGVWY